MIHALEYYHNQSKKPYGLLIPKNISINSAGEICISSLSAKDLNTLLNYVNYNMDYNAPEIIWKPFKAFIVSDYYSLGVVIYKMLFGETPYCFKKAKS